MDALPTAIHLISRSNIDAILDTGNLYVAMRNGRWYKARRNGQTKRWKRDVSRIYVPIKFGFRGTVAINETDFTYQVGFLRPEYFRRSDDVPANLRS